MSQGCFPIYHPDEGPEQDASMAQGLPWMAKIAYIIIKIWRFNKSSYKEGSNSHGYWLQNVADVWDELMQMRMDFNASVEKQNM